MIIEVLEFIFQDFLHFLGTFLLLGVIANGFKGIVNIDKSIKIKKDGKKNDNT